MSSSIITSTLIIFVIPSILLLFSPPTNATSSSTLINKVCSAKGKNFGTKFCTQLLESQPMVVSATNMIDLSAGIIKSGISRSTLMRTYIENLLKKRSMDPKLQGALKECNSSYDGVILSLNSALSEVDEKEFQTASYDLLLAGTDNIEVCQKAVASKGMNDKIISRGNKVVQVFAFSANQAVMSLGP